LHKLASTSLGGDSTVEASYTIYKASQDTHASSDAGHDAAEVPSDTTMPFRHTSTTRRCLRKPFTSSASDHFPKNISAVEDTFPAGEGIPAAAPTIPTATDKGKAPIVDDSLPVDLLSEQERVLKNLHDYQLGEELAKKLHAEQEVEFTRQQEELAQKAQAERVLGDDVNEENMNERLGMLLMRKRQELAEQSRVKPMNKTQQRDYMRGFMKNQSASVYNQGWTMKQMKALSLSQLKHEFKYIQRTLERSNLHNFKRTTLRPAPSLEAPSAKQARQEVPQDVHVASLQVLASVPAAPSVVDDVSVLAAPSVAADVSVPAVPLDPAVDSAHVDTEVHADESNPEDTLTASEQVFAEHTVAASTPSSSRTRRKHLAKKRVTPIVDIADDALIKFDNASDSDDDPLPYAPYVGWEMVHSLLGSIHAYYDMEGHTKHFTSLRELLHMVEKNDLRRFLGQLTYSQLAFISSCSAYAEAWVGSPKVACWRRFDHGRTAELASPEQTATGKDVSNPFMAVMVCQKPLGDGFVCFFQYVDPTKVRIGERQIEEGQVPLLDSTVGHVIALVEVLYLTDLKLLYSYTRGLATMEKFQNH
nr:JmjC domain-containing protein [Tanacetum cinerariifolium]